MIDIIVPNYNGAHLLPTCLDALRAQTRRDWVCTVVDDGSTDDSLALLATHYPDVRVLALPENIGLTKALNAALAATSAPIIVLLNNDTEADPCWLERLVGALERWPAYDFAASKLLLFDRRDALHSAGDGYHPNGRPFNRGVWERDRGQYDAIAEVWGPCAGAAAYRRSTLDALADDGAVFDTDLFMYCEDVDLALRARLAGVRTVFVPHAVVYHKVSATGGGTLASFWVGRNMLAVWLKNMPAPLIWRWAVPLLVDQLRIAADALRHWRGAAARARLRGQWAGLRAAPLFWRKRRVRQQHVTVEQFGRFLGTY
jgi:GT2 family glycosyltransferase